ncbi:hypothetical protein SH449x_000162 [Pirellulaceae bacterium SH449]
MMKYDMIKVAQLRLGAAKASRRYLDRNPWFSVEDVEQDTFVLLESKIASIRSPFTYGYSTARRLCIKINKMHRKYRAALKEHVSGVQVQYDEIPSESCELQDSLITLFNLEKDTALTLLMKMVMGCSYKQLPEQIEAITGEHRSASYYRLKVNAGIEAMRRELLDVTS